MNLVDSSGWLEYLADGPKSGEFASPIEDTAKLIVPTICVYEVFKTAARQRGEDQALQAAALMRQGRLVDLTDEVALLAARTSLDRQLPMADAIIMATALLHDALLWTMDEHFKGLPGVRFIAPGKGPRT